MTEPKVIKSLPKERLNELLSNLQKYQIFAPINRDYYSEFTHIKNKSNIDLNLCNTTLPAKGLILAQTLSMLKFDVSAKLPRIEMTINEQTEIPTQIIFAIRPCDASGIAALDPTFNSDFKDPYYLKVRNNTVLVGLACNEPAINCFCTSVGGGPFDGTKMDVMMIDIGSSYLFNFYTDKGQELIEGNSELFEIPTNNQLEMAKVNRVQAESKPTRKMNTHEIQKQLDNLFESDYWESVSNKCLGCGICTYICPTCYCFDITDENQGRKGERVRTWDSCMYSEYTVHASGHNPRPARTNRIRNRFYHKFKYYPDLYSIFGCTGCGRCIKYCPTNVDIIDIINGVKQLQHNGEPLDGDDQ